jgi:hypothetical protein
MTTRSNYVLQTPALTRAEQLALLKFRDSQKPALINVGNLPAYLRDPLLLNLGLIGQDVGIIPNLLFREDQTEAAKQKKAERKRRWLEYWLSLLGLYAKRYWEVAIKTSIVKKAIEVALIRIDAEIDQKEAALDNSHDGLFAAIASPKGEIAELHCTKQELIAFRDTELAEHEAVLEQEESPSIAKLDRIEKSIDKKLSKFQVLKNAFEYVLEKAVVPAAAYAYTNALQPTAERISDYISSFRLPESFSTPPVASNANNKTSSDGEVEDGDGEGDVKSARVKFQPSFTDTIIADPE